MMANYKASFLGRQLDTFVFFLGAKSKEQRGMNKIVEKERLPDSVVNIFRASSALTS